MTGWLFFFHIINSTASVIVNIEIDQCLTLLVHINSRIAVKRYKYDNNIRHDITCWQPGYCKACIFHEFRVFFFFKREIFMTRNCSYHTYIYIYIPRTSLLSKYIYQSRKIHVAEIFTRQNVNNSCARKIHALQYWVTLTF